MQFLLPSLDQVRRAHDDRPVRLAGRMGMHGTGPHLRFARPALAAQVDGLLPLQGFDGGGDDVGLGRQHRPLQVERDYGIGGGNVQRLESLAGTSATSGP